jgi:hypothetical protein
MDTIRTSAQQGVQQIQQAQQTAEQAKANSEAVAEVKPDMQVSREQAAVSAVNESFVAPAAVENQAAAKIDSQNLVKQESETSLAPLKKSYPQLKEFCSGDGYNPDECSTDAIISAKFEYCSVEENAKNEICKESIVVHFRSTSAPKDYPTLANFCVQVEYADHACGRGNLERMKNKFCLVNSRSPLCNIAKSTSLRKISKTAPQKDLKPNREVTPKVETPQLAQTPTQQVPIYERREMHVQQPPKSDKSAKREKQESMPSQLGVSKPDSLEEIRRKAAEETQKMYERRAEKARLAEQQRIDSELAEQERIHKLEVKEQERIAKEEEKKKKIEEAKQARLKKPDEVNKDKTATSAGSANVLGSEKLDKALAESDLLTVAEIFGSDEYVASSTTKVCEVLRNIMDSPVPMAQDHIVKHALMKRLQFLNKVLDVNDFAVNGGDVRWDKKKYNEGIRNIARVGRSLRVSSYRSEYLKLSGVAATWGRGIPEILIKEEGKGALFCDARNRLSLVVDQSLVELIFWVQGPSSPNTSRTLVMNPALRASDIRDLLDRRQKEMKTSGMGYAILKRLVELGNSLDDLKGEERRQRFIQFTDLQLLVIKFIRDEVDKKGPGAGIINREQALSLKSMLSKAPVGAQLGLTIDKALGAE